MWVYYYVSKARIAQMSEQIPSKLPVEQIRKWDLRAGAMASAEGETSRLLELVGLKGKAAAKADGGATRSSEDKFTATDEAIVERVRQHLMTQVEHSALSPSSKLQQVSGLHSLVRFCGDFSPDIPGEGAERFAVCQEQSHLRWQGNCGEIPVTFVTSQGSLVSPTALLSFLTGEIESLRLDGFATLLEGCRQTPLAILPLFFGREVDE